LLSVHHAALSLSSTSTSLVRSGGRTRGGRRHL